MQFVFEKTAGLKNPLREIVVLIPVGDAHEKCEGQYYDNGSNWQAPALDCADWDFLATTGVLPAEAADTRNATAMDRVRFGGQSSAQTVGRTCAMLRVERMITIRPLRTKAL